MIQSPKRPPISLKRFFRKKAVRWALLGFIGTLCFAIPCVLYSAKITSERHLLSTAKATVRAYRPLILQEDIRHVQFQMNQSLELKDGESAIIFDADLEAIYPINDDDKTPPCRDPKKYCWGSKFQTVSLLYPIYFDGQNETGLFGYLALTLKPKLDVTLISALSIFLLIAFMGQALGLSSALNQSAQQIGDQLSQWSTHLKTSPGERPKSRESVPFYEMSTMQEAVDGLYLEIEKLRKETAKKAKTEAQVTILQEIGHDLRTPHSLLAKYFALHLDTVSTTGQIKQIEVDRVIRTLKRMGELLRQVRIFSFNKSHLPGQKNPTLETCFLDIETASILEDLRHDPEIVKKQVRIDFTATARTCEAPISRVAYYRLLENLVHNACDAVPEDQGWIKIELKTQDNCVTLMVQDNGCGIPLEHRDKLFDFDFTTKPSRGTGLGLGIVNKICEEFGAKLLLESNPGMGTIFMVTFKTLDYSVTENEKNEGSDVRT